MTHKTPRSMAALAIVLIGLVPAPARGDEVKHHLPIVANVFPQGWERDAALEVDVMGEFLDRAQSVLFLDPSIRGEVLESDFTRARLKFTVSADAPLGPHYFRVISPRGASNLMIFRVGDQPHIIETEPNDRHNSPEPVSLPLTMNARLDREGDFDFFRFQADNGQTWIFDLRSARNGNGLDPALILLDAQGRKLEHVEDRFIWDPFFAHTFDEAGEYTAVVQPTRRMNPAFAYQLDIRQAAHLKTVSPIAFEPGETREALVYGSGLTDAGAKLWFNRPGFKGDVLDANDTTARVRISIPESAPDGEYQLAFENAGRSSVAHFLVESTPRHDGGDNIQIPTAITGVAQYRRPESFFFEAKTGATMVFEVRAHRYGSPVDAVLRVLDDAGQQVAKNDDNKHPGIAFNKDPRLLYTFQQAGRYELQVRNLSKVTGEDYPYLLTATHARPHAELMLGDDRPYIYEGADGTLKVQIIRHDGYEGPVTLRVEGLPEGVNAEPVLVPAIEKEGQITFKASGASAGSFAQIKVVAEEAGANAWRSVRIASGGGEGATFAPVEHATLAVVEPSPFELEVGFSSANLVKGGTVEIPVMIRRREGFDEPIRFAAQGLPKGVHLKAATAEAADTSVTIELQADHSVATGPYRWVSILGETSSGKVEEAPKITVTID